MTTIECKILTPKDIKIYEDEITCLMEVVLHDNITQHYPPNLAGQYVQKMTGFIQDGSAVIVGGFLENKLVGFSWAYEMDIFGEKRLHIDMLCVAPSFRKRGIAHNLVQKQVQEARKRKIGIIEAMVTCKNESSYNWFHSMGFENERVKVSLEINND